MVKFHPEKAFSVQGMEVVKFCVCWQSQSLKSGKIGLLQQFYKIPEVHRGLFVPF